MKAKSNLHRRSGSTLLYFMMLLVLMAGLASLAVDVARVRVAKAELQTAIDAATLAGSSGLPYGPTEVRRRAKEIASQNTVNGRPLVLLDEDIDLGTWNDKARSFTQAAPVNEPTATAVRVTGRLRRSRGSAVNLAFLPMVSGQGDFEVTTAAVSGMGAAPDVLVVQDVTNSFAEEISYAKTGDQALLDALKNIGGKSAFGLVAFAGWAKTIADLDTINSKYNNFTDAISSLALSGSSSAMPPRSGTDISTGIDEGLKVYDNYGSKSTNGKVMIIVSDGQPENSPNGKNKSMTNSQLLSLAQSKADEAWSKGIHVYVVFFDRNNDAVAASNLRSLTRGNGLFVQVPDPTQLPAALSDITKRLPMKLVQ